MKAKEQLIIYLATKGEPISLSCLLLSDAVAALGLTVDETIKLLRELLNQHAIWVNEDGKLFAQMNTNGLVADRYGNEK